MEVHTSYVIKRHSDGSLITLRLEIAKDIRSAARFLREEDFLTFINGYHGPENPEDYYLQEIEILYREVHP